MQTHEDLVESVAALAVEVKRLQEMVQTLSESHDLNRREIQAATKRAVDLTLELDRKTVAVDDLLKRRGQ